MDVRQGSEMFSKSEIGSTDPYLPNRVLIFEDDFLLSEINTDNWTAEIGYKRNAELQYYTADRAKTDNSILTIKAVRDTTYPGYGWTSASLRTSAKKAFLYGRIEAKIKMDSMQGACPAFWMVGDSYGWNPANQLGNGLEWPNSGEIDILEHFNASSKIKSTVIYKNVGNTIIYQDAGISPDIDVTRWHVYAIEWTAKSIVFSIDGVSYGTFAINDASIAYPNQFAYASELNPFKTPQVLWLDVAIGMHSDTTNDNLPTPSDVECNMYVDWVRVYAPTTVTSALENVCTAVVPTFLCYADKKYTVAPTSALTITLSEGATYLTAAYLPSTVVTRQSKFYSSDQTVATIDELSGKITPLKVGSTTITVIDNVTRIHGSRVLNVT